MQSLTPILGIAENCIIAGVSGCRLTQKLFVRGLEARFRDGFVLSMILALIIVIIGLIIAVIAAIIATTAATAIIAVIIAAMRCYSCSNNCCTPLQLQQYLLSAAIAAVTAASCSSSCYQLLEL